MTPAEIIFHRRVAVLDHARRTGNVAQACRTFGVSRTRYYEWKSVVEHYGLEALMPKARRTPQLPNATPTHVVAPRGAGPGRAQRQRARIQSECVLCPPGGEGPHSFADPPRSPNHNSVCGRFHGTILQECWRPAFHRRRFVSIRQLQSEADAWLVRYNQRRKNHGDYMRGRTPKNVLDSFKQSKAA